MRHQHTYAAGFLLWVVAAQSYALTGNEYRTLPDSERLAWTVGVADGILTTQLFTTNKKPPLAECLGKLDRAQIRAMFEKTLEQQPGQWNFPAAFMFYLTFQKFCGLE